MGETSNPDLNELNQIIARQKVLGRRLVWLFILPFGMTAAMVVMFLVLNSKLADVELALKVVTIERFLLVDKNNTWAIHRYEQIASGYRKAPILARIGALENNPQTAIEKLTIAKNLDPQSWETYRSLAFAYLLANQMKEAIAAGQKALELDSDDANTYNNLAWIYAKAGPELRDFAKAEEYGLAAVRLTNNHQWNFIDTLAEVYHEKGDSSKSLIYLRKAIEICPRENLLALKGKFKVWFPNEPLETDGGTK